MKKILLLMTLAFLLPTLFSFVKFQQKTPWNVPDKYQKMANPVKSSPESIANGKSLWGLHCKSCHGGKGKGDGPKAAQLDTECGDFTTADFQKQSDGSIFYKTLEGRKDMPSFKKKIEDESDIWALVNYIRTMK
jgi:mono/diheme cytochrome c family protein